MRYKQLIDSPFGKLIFPRTKAAIVKALASASDGDRFLLHGIYDFSADPGNPLLVQKNVELVGLNNCAFVGGAGNSNIVLINSISKRLVFRNIKFQSMATGDGYPTVYINEEGDVQSLLFDTCEWEGTGANGFYNGFSINTYNEFNGVGNRVRNLKMIDPYVHDYGRMGMEFLAHKWDRDYRVTDLSLINPRIYRCGMKTPDGGGHVGMAVSGSGDLDRLTIVNPDIQDCIIGIELIGVQNYTVMNPRIKSGRFFTTSETTWDGKPTILKHGSIGISCTNGLGSTDGNSYLRYPKGNVTGGIIDVSGAGLNCFNTGKITFNDIDITCGESLVFQHGVGTRLSDVNVEATPNKFIAFIEDQNEMQVSGGRWSRQKATRENVLPDQNGNVGFYAPLGLNGVTNSVFDGLNIWTNMNINGGNSDNYYNEEQDFRNRYISNADVSCSLVNISLNGVRLPDCRQEVVPTLTITGGNAATPLVHINRVVFNPSAALDSYTLTLPAGIRDKQELSICFGGQLNGGVPVVRNLTINGPSGNTPIWKAAPTTGLSGMVLPFQYDMSIGRWRLLSS